MVHGGASKRGGRFVTGFASCSGSNMRTWFTQGCRPVMASRATCSDARMVHRTCTKGCRRFMACFTRRCGFHVCTWLAFSRRAIMAGRTT